MMHAARFLWQEIKYTSARAGAKFHSHDRHAGEELRQIQIDFVFQNVVFHIQPVLRLLRLLRRDPKVYPLPQTADERM